MAKLNRPSDKDARILNQYRSRGYAPFNRVPPLDGMVTIAFPPHSWRSRKRYVYVSFDLEKERAAAAASWFHAAVFVTHLENMGYLMDRDRTTLEAFFAAVEQAPLGQPRPPGQIKNICTSEWIETHIPERNR